MPLIYIASPELVPASARHLPSAPFIVGVPRTGTTLLRMMLDAHPALSIPAETDFLADLIPALRTVPHPAEYFLSRIIGDPRWKDHQLDPLVLRQRILAIRPFDTGEAIRAFYRLCGERWGKPRFGDKTPGYRNYMLMIQEVLPEARFIHILRDGRDVLLSHKLTWWAPDTLADAANLWTKEVHKARAAAIRLAYYMELRYEDLLRDTEGQLRRICDFLDLPWDERMLQYYEWSERRLAEFSDCVRPDGKFISGDQWRGLHALTTKPPDVSRSGRWKQEMPESEQRQFEALAGDLIDELGYERRFGLFAAQVAEGRRGERENGRTGEENARVVSPSPLLPFSPSSAVPLVTVARAERVPVVARALPAAPFIVGVPRSGTTLLRLMLDAHPALAIPAETDFLADLIPVCRQAAQPAEPFLIRVTSDIRFKDHQIDPGVLRQRILAIQPFDMGEALRTFYRLCGERFGKTRFGDKTPGYRGYMAMIQETLPEARFIHIVRDGRDVAVSHKSTWWAPNSIAEAAAFWAKEVQNTRASSADLAYYMEIRYEDLLRETEASLRKVCSFLDLPWDDCMLNYHERSAQRLAEFNDFVMANGRRISAHARRDIQAMTKKPPDVSRSGRWKTEMTEAEQREYEVHAGEVLERFGYERKFGTSERAEPEVRKEEDAPSFSRPSPLAPRSSLIYLARPELVPVRARQLPPMPFICGVGRSGTTLLRMMLDAHPDLAIPAETDFVPDLVTGCPTAADPVQFYLDRVTGDPRWQDHQLDADVLRQRIEAIQPFDVGAAIRAFYRLCAERWGKPRFGDKTPGYSDWLPLIQEALPEARFIHIIRDGRDVILSQKPKWGPKTIAGAARRWMTFIRNARGDSAGIAYYLEIRYEDLLSDTEATLRKVCDFIALPWDAHILKYHERAEQRLAEFKDYVFEPTGKHFTAEQRRDSHALTTRPPDPSRAGRWKTELTESQQREYENRAGHLLELLGYERRFGPSPAPSTPQPSEESKVRVQKEDTTSLSRPSLLCLTRPELLPAQARALPPAPFIVGMPRSGTTLLRLMLDAHPAMAIPSETGFVPKVIAGCRTASQPAELFLAQVIGHHFWVDHHLDADLLRRTILGIQPFDIGAALRAFYRLCGARFGKTRFGDKTPDYLYSMPLIQEALPEARFIHIIRDGRDVALSVQSTWFGAKSYAHAAHGWKFRMDKAHAACPELAYYLEIRYEDLVRDTEATLRKVCAFLDLPWDAGMLNYHERSEQRLAEWGDETNRPDGQFITGEQKRAIHVFTTRPPDSSRCGRWQTELSEDDQRMFEASVGELLDRFGYERRFGMNAIADSKVEKEADTPSFSRPSPLASRPSLICVARPELVPAKARALPPMPFIVGVGRSGTTLLRLMLDAHPALAIPPETTFVPDAIKGCRTAPNPAEFFLQTVLGDSRWPDYQLDADVLRQRILGMQPFDTSAALRAFYRLYGERSGKLRFGEKSPSYAENMPLIQEGVPEARFIHIIRDGRDVAVSVMPKWWGPKTIQQAAGKWTSLLGLARAGSAELAYYMEVRYEDLLRETEATLRRICEFIDLPWDARMLEYHERAGERLAEFSDWVGPGGVVVSGDQRRALHALTTKPPDSSRVGRWKTEMSASDQREYEKLAGNLLGELGYERASATRNELAAPLLCVNRPELAPVQARQLPPAPFIVGVPRSGTTLLRMMLDAHPAMAIPSETDFLPEVIAGCPTSADPVAFFLARVLGDNRWSDHHLDADVFRARIAAIEPFDVGQAIRAFYRLAGERWNKPRFGDKTPGYVLYLPQIQQALPEAHFIHIIRDGRDVALSVKPTWWGPKTIDDAARRWTRNLNKARADSAQLAHYLEIRYEDLIQDTETILRQVCEFIQLPWDDCMLDYHQHSARRLAELTDSVRPDGQFIVAERWRDIHALTTKPPDTSRAGRWKTEMPEHDQREYEALAGELLGYFGYERRFAAEEGKKGRSEDEKGRMGEGDNGRGETAHAVSPSALLPFSPSPILPKRLLFASYHCYVDPSSGAAQSARDLMPALAARGWQCRVFCGPHLDFEDGRLFRQVMNSPTFGLGAGPVVADRPCTGAAVPCSLVDFAQGDIPITVFDAPRTRSLQPPDRDEGYVFLAYFERLLDEFRPDVLLTYGGHWAAIELMAAAHRRGIPIVFWLHNCFYHTGEFFKPMAGVIVPSQFARQHYLTKLKLDFTELPPPLDWPGRVCDKVEGKYVTFVNPQPDKGVFVFAAIAQELHRLRPDIPFLVVEGRSKLSWLRDAGLDLDKLGNVFGMGATTDPRTFYRVSKMVLMPSLWDETFGRVASEALANGIPVLASRRGGLPEALAEAGFLFDVPAKYTPQTRLMPSAREITPWVETIIRLWDDQAFYENEQQRCRAAAHVWAPEKVGETYDNYLSGLLNKSRQRAIGAAVSRPLVSVVMPVYNGSAYLERAVRSVQQQTMPAWELLAVDDCSTDSSHDMLTRLAGQDPRIRVSRLPENRGPSAARNHALSQVRGDVICYLDCDDEYYAIHLERVWARHGEAEVLMCPYDLVNERVGAPDFGARTTYDPRIARDDLLQKKANMIVGLGVAHRRALLQRTGLFNENLSFEEDWDLWKRFVDAGATFSFVEHRGGLYHTRADSLSRTRRKPERRAVSVGDRSVPAAEKTVAATTAPIFVLSAGGPGDGTVIEQLLLSTRQVFLWGEQRGIFVENLLRIVEDMRSLKSPRTQGYREKSLENGAGSPAPSVHPELAVIQEGCREFLERVLGQTARARGYPRWGMNETRLGRDAALFLQELFPDARFILLVRNPAASLQAIKSTAPYSQDFADDPAAFLQSWAKIGQELVAVKGDLRRAQLFRYEDLLAHPQQALNAISQIADIPVSLFDGTVFDHHSATQPALDDADMQAVRDAAVQGVAEKLGYEAKEGVLASS